MARLLNKKSAAVNSEGMLKYNLMSMRDYLEGNLSDEDFLYLLEKVPENVSNQDGFVKLCTQIGTSLMNKATLQNLFVESGMQSKDFGKAAQNSFCFSFTSNSCV